MVSLISVFTVFVILFAVIGAMRGWAKELLVTSAVVLGLFLNAILETYVEPYRSALFMQTGGTQFLIRGGFLALLAFFGYQTPSARILRDKVAREHLQDMLLGLVLGAVNGYGPGCGKWLSADWFALVLLASCRIPDGSRDPASS